MAELSASLATSASPPLTRQLAAIAWLRWRVFVNTLSRKGGLGSIIAYVVMVPILLGVLVGPTIGAFAASFYLVQAGTPDRLSWVLWGAFALTQLFNLNLGAPGTTVDPTQLLRFPIAVRQYVVIRLFFGLISPGNLMMGLASLAVAAGITAARPSLWWIAFPALATFGVTNLLFTRMIFAWVDRWLSTRRAREVFTGLIFVLSLGFQWANVTFNPGLNHHRGRTIAPEQLRQTQHFIAVAKPVLAVLPPELTSSAVQQVSAGRPLDGTAYVIATAAFGALFCAIFSLRIRTEYRGENLSDKANAVAKAPKRAGKAAGGTIAVPRPVYQSDQVAVPSPGVHLRAIFGKEILSLRRNVGLFYGLIAPAVMVFLFAGRLSLRGHSPWVLPAAAAYALLGVAPLTYNSFGLEGTGAQLYFYAPVRLRDVFLAKNLLAMLIGLFELAVVIGIICYVAAPPSVGALVLVLLWSVGSLFCTTTVGNFMSIRSPKRVNPGRTANKQAAPLSALLAMAILLTTAAIGAAGMLLDQFFYVAWAPPTAVAVVVITGALLYWLTLPALERFALNHRDMLFEELGKKT